MTTLRIARSGSVIADVAAPLPAVWAVVCDPARTGEWSHECHDATWAGTSRAAAVGARFRGRNRSGWMRWTRTCEITALEPEREIAWRTVPTLMYPDSTQWRIELENTGRGVRIIQSFEVTKLPRWLERVLVRINPTHIDRSNALREDLHRLANLAAREHVDSASTPR